jgi:transposase
VIHLSVDRRSAEDHGAAIIREVIVGRSKTGEAISADRRTPTARKMLRRFIDAAQKRGDLGCWRRGRAVLGYLDDRRVVDLAIEAGVTRGSVNRWLQWYEALGVDGLLTGTAPGAPPRLTDEERAQLIAIVEGGPMAAGYQSGVWTGPMIGDLIQQRFGVGYHNHHIPRLLHQLGFSVQRPRKRLAHADALAQEYWLRVRLPTIKKKPPPAAAS